MLVKVWLICCDLIRFDQAPLLGVCPTSVLELNYHTKSLVVCTSSLPHIHMENVTASTTQVRWCSDKPTQENSWESLFESSFCRNKQSGMNEKGILQRELSEWRPGLCHNVVWPFQNSFSFSSICSFPSHQLCIPATSWTRRGKLVTSSNITPRQQDLHVRTEKL